MLGSSSSLTNFLPLAKIGEGTFSSVYQVRRVTDQQVYALKKIKIVSLKEKEKANALNQIRILASLTSSYIISYKQAFFDEKLHLLCIVMEWANQGDLLQKIASFRERRQRLPEEEIWKATYQILSGLHTLHRNSILHRDMKSANIFINDGSYKLGDLNVSKVNDHEQSLVRTQTGTPFYASPEIWRDEPYGSQSDIWSFGCIIYEMCCLRPPFNGKDLSELYKNVQKGYYQPIPKTYSKELALLIDRCLTLKSRERPSAEELLREGEIIKERCEFYEIPIENTQQLQSKEKLLATIKMPFDMKKLNSKLPQSKYSKIIDEQDKQKTMIKSSHSSYLNSPDYSHMTGSGYKMHENRSDLLSPQRESCIGYVYKQKESVPQKIKNQLNKINKAAHERISSKNQRVEMPKAVSSIKSSFNKRPPESRLPDYLTPIKEIPNRKQRPLSCNYVNLKQKNLSKSPYHINNLNRYENPSMVYHSDRKPLSALREKRDLISDRRLGLCDRDPYLIEKNKYRCSSANHIQPSSALSDFKKRLDLRGNKATLVDSSSSDRKGMNLKPHIKSEASLRNLSGNSSELMKNNLNNYLYRSPQSRGYGYRKNQSSYLEEVQNKILSSANPRLKRSENILGYKGQSDSRIKRLVKGSNLYCCRSSNRL